jgi:hypothetical protein
LLKAQVFKFKKTFLNLILYPQRKLWGTKKKNKPDLKSFDK